MDQLDRSELSRLVDARHDICVSIYLPTHRRGRDVQQDPSRLKNLLRRAEDEAQQAGLRAPVAEKLLAPARALLGDDDFWNHQADGLALFLTADSMRTLRLPVEFDELCTVGHRFHVKPLLPLVGRDGRYYVLAVSQKRVRVLEASRFDVRELQPDRVPQSLADALGAEDHEKTLQFHSTASGSAGGERGQVAFHGQGGGDADREARLRGFFREIDRGLGELLGGGHAPLVIAGVEHHVPIYRETNTYPHLLDAVAAGNPDGLSAAQLHERTWPLVEPLFAKREETVVERFLALAGTGKTADDPAAVVVAARNGQVDALLVARDRQCWGEIGDDGAVVVHAERASGDRDLLDAAVAATLRNGGEAYARRAVDMPRELSVAAVLRY